tara:strand:- start:11006 stop:12208 length:1203 start_codon:yes stop_codon:yes gene_type:complete
MAARLEAWTSALLTNAKTKKEDAEKVHKVLKEMRAHYKSDCSFMSKVSMVKRNFMDATPSASQTNTHRDFEKSKKKLRDVLQGLDPKSACAKRIAGFLDESTPLRVQYREWKRYQNPDFCEKESAVKNVFSSMKVLPDFMDAFTADVQTFHKCKKLSEKNLEARHDKVMQLKNGNALLRKFVAILEDAEILNDPSKGRSELIIALCAVSGRRMAEILNPHSKFRPYAGSKRGVVFDGQLKKHALEGFKPYAVPLIGVDASTFIKALKAFRTKQGDGDSSLSLRELSAKYQSNAGAKLKVLMQDDGKPLFRKFHNLRTFYVAGVMELYDWGAKGKSRVLQKILGHKSMKTFHNYSDMEVTGFSQDIYGTFPLSVDESMSDAMSSLSLRDTEPSPHEKKSRS